MRIRGAKGRGFVYMSFDIGDFEKTINELSQGKEGRKLIRRTARHALEIFNEHTIKNAKSINFKD